VFVMSEIRVPGYEKNPKRFLRHSPDPKRHRNRNYAAQKLCGIRQDCLPHIICELAGAIWSVEFRADPDSQR
jgi:hypothetical protein